MLVGGIAITDEPVYIRERGRGGREKEARARRVWKGSHHEMLHVETQMSIPPKFQ